jgi:dephospho-CoA kinase
VLKVGITGGIGSGKSVVCHIFNVLGIPVYNADERAKFLISIDRNIRNEIIRVFGKDSYNAEGYNSKYIASLVFRNSDLLNCLNNIVHPRVVKDFKKWIHLQENAKYIIEETAILFESGAFKKTDRIILVDAPNKIRINRVLERDNVSEEEIRNRMKNQWPTNKIRPIADWIIENDDNNLILPQILAIHNQLMIQVHSNG